MLCYFIYVLEAIANRFAV